MQYKVDIIYSLHQFVKILAEYIGYYLAILINKTHSFI